MVTQHTSKDTPKHKLKKSGRLSEAHWHPKPPKLAPVGNEGRIIRRGALKQDIVEASLQVQHAEPLSPPELRPVPPHIIELVLVLGHPFIEWDNVLAYPVGLPRLNAQY